MYTITAIHGIFLIGIENIRTQLGTVHYIFAQFTFVFIDFTYIFDGLLRLMPANHVKMIVWWNYFANFDIKHQKIVVRKMAMNIVKFS